MSGRVSTVFSIKPFEALTDQSVITRHRVDHQLTYSRQRPVATYGAEASPRVAAALKRYFSRTIVSVPEQHAFIVKNAATLRSGIIVTETNEVVKETLYNLDGKQEYFDFTANGKDSIERKKDERGETIPGHHNVMLCTTESVFGHWLLELAPKLAVARQLGLDDQKFLVSFRTPMRHHLRRLFEAYGLSPDKQVVNIYDKLTRFQSLAYLPPRNHYLEWISPSVVSFMDDFGKRLTSGAPHSARRRLFITRDGASDRQLINRREVVDALSAYGFDAIDPSSLPFEDQVALFQSAEIIVGVSGSALANIVFARKDTPVVFLTSDEMAGIWFYDICSIRGLPYSVVTGRAAHQPDVKHYRRDFSVDPTDVARAVRQVLPARGYLRWRSNWAKRGWKRYATDPII